MASTITQLKQTGHIQMISVPVKLATIKATSRKNMTAPSVDGV